MKLYASCRSLPAYIAAVLLTCSLNWASAARFELTPVQDTVVRGSNVVPSIGQRTVNFDDQGIPVDASLAQFSIGLLGYDLSGVRGEITDAYLSFYQVDTSSVDAYAHETSIVDPPNGTPMFDESRISYTTFETDYGFNRNIRSNFGRINLSADTPGNQYYDSRGPNAQELVRLNALFDDPGQSDPFVIFAVRGNIGSREWGDREGTGLSPSEPRPVKLVLVTLVPEPASAGLTALLSVAVLGMARRRGGGAVRTSVIAALALCLLTAPSAWAQTRTWQSGFQSGVTSGAETMPFRLYLPEGYSHEQEYPMVFFMHGAGERGVDNQDQVDIHIAGLIDRTYSDYPAIMVAPQVESGGSWHPGLSQDLTLEIIDWIESNYSVDTDRRYLTGLSMGGFGTTTYASIFPEMWAAIAPMSGATGIPLSVDEPLADIPTWLFHGSSDGVVSVGTSRNYYLNATGESSITFESTEYGYPTTQSGEIIYTELSGRGHNIWNLIYNNSNTALYDWMFSQSRSSGLTIIPKIPEPTGAALLGLLVLSGFCRTTQVACRR